MTAPHATCSQIGSGSPTVWLTPVRIAGSRCLDLLFPPVCPYCGTRFLAGYPGPVFCQPCRDVLSDGADNVCQRCATRLRSATECGECRDQKFRFRRTLALGPYQGELRQAIVRMKHFGEQSLTWAIGILLAQELERRNWATDLDGIVPLPLHWTRRFQRGVNGPDLIAAAVADRVGLPLLKKGLIRLRPTEKQSMLTANRRRENVRDAFAVRTGQPLKGRHLALVDDALTSGATANEATKVLLRAGASAVTLLVLARASWRQ